MVCATAQHAGCHELHTHQPGSLPGEPGAWPRLPQPPLPGCAEPPAPLGQPAGLPDQPPRCPVLAAAEPRAGPPALQAWGTHCDLSGSHIAFLAVSSLSSTNRGGCPQQGGTFQHDGHHLAHGCTIHAAAIVTLRNHLQLHCQTVSTAQQVRARSTETGQSACSRQLPAALLPAAPWAMEASVSRLCRSFPSLLLRSLSLDTSASSSPWA